jgi:hypothetical protein
MNKALIVVSAKACGASDADNIPAHKRVLAIDFNIPASSFVSCAWIRGGRLVDFGISRVTQRSNPDKGVWQAISFRHSFPELSGSLLSQMY